MLSGGIAPLNFKLDCRWMWVMRLKPLAILLPEKKPWWLGDGAGLDVLLLSRIEPKTFQLISYSVY